MIWEDPGSREDLVHASTPGPPASPNPPAKFSLWFAGITGYEVNEANGTSGMMGQMQRAWNRAMAVRARPADGRTSGSVPAAEAAFGVDDLAGDPGGLVCDQPGDQAGGVVGGAPAPGGEV